MMIWITVISQMIWIVDAYVLWLKHFQMSFRDFIQFKFCNSFGVGDVIVLALNFEFNFK